MQQPPVPRPARVPAGAHRSAGLAVMFALGEVEALVAAFARLLLFVLFPGAFLGGGESNKHEFNASLEIRSHRNKHLHS